MLPNFTLHGQNTNEDSQHDTFQSYYSLDFNAKIVYYLVLHFTEYNVNTRILDQGSKKRLQVNYVYNFGQEIFQASSFSAEWSDSKLKPFFNNNSKYSES